MTAKAFPHDQHEKALRLLSASRQFLQNPRRWTVHGLAEAVHSCAHELEIDPGVAMGLLMTRLISRTHGSCSMASISYRAALALLDEVLDLEEEEQSGIYLIQSHALN